jgi:hypothetical protein
MLKTIILDFIEFVGGPVEYSLPRAAIPLNTLFMTSFFITIVVYSMTISLALMKSIGMRFFSTATTVLHMFERSPFASLGLLVGFVGFTFFQ